MRRTINIEIMISIIFTTLYAVLVVIFAPISFQVIQVRLADALLPLSIIFGWPVIIGTTLGAIISNFYGGLGAIDIFGGATANFIATFLAWKLSQIKFIKIWAIAITVEVIVISVIVGTYLSYLFKIPIIFSLLTIFLGSFISIGILGYFLLLSLSRQPMLKFLNSKGIKLYLNDA